VDVGLGWGLKPVGNGEGFKADICGRVIGKSERFNAATG
jgi:hypothetical protein